ncbi:hypothetical protein AB1K56_11390 [Microbacterium sp. BWR-S6Y]|uniref:hypothetical protein n=1 Tax=Microbacterium sp. BWR-S6Y TaxID=3232073 RepID=UPI003529C8C0
MSNESATRIPGARPRGGGRTIAALVVGIAAAIVAGLLIVPYLARPGLVALPVLALALAVVGVVLAVRARRQTGLRTRGRTALVSSLVALVVDVVLIVVFVGTIAGLGLASVELRATGPDDNTVTFSSATEQRTLQWGPEGRAQFNTSGTWTEITVTAPADSADQNVSCEIVWNGEVVVDESSGSGTVTCRYDAG